MNMFGLAVLFVVVVTGVFSYLHLPMFGSFPSGARLERIKQSPNYKDGKFHNRKEITVGTMDMRLSNIYHDYTKNADKRVPAIPLPSVKTDIKNIERKEDVLIWFGHSSFFIQLDGMRYLFDPVFSDISSPILFMPKAFKGSNIYSPTDIPDIDHLVITHDHWDHLDYKTVTKLESRINKVICPLGVGAHLERWGFNNSKIIELDWNDTVQIADEIKLFCLSTQHFSGRGFTRNKSLWGSFLILSKTFNFYVSGDGGYGSHFSEVGKIAEHIDLAILENGQYNRSWRNIHMFPEDTIQAALDLKAATVMPCHIGKFSLSTHAWNEPLERTYQLSQGKAFRLITPMIGEKVNLKDSKQKFSKWW